MDGHSNECISCGGRSEWLCDFHLGWPIAGHAKDGTPLTGTLPDGSPPLPFTCDAPLCNACRRYQYMFHASGRGGWSESVDYCPIHSTMKSPGIDPITAPDADRRRRDVWAQYRRARLSLA